MSAAELDSWDLVLAMTRQHLRALECLAERVGVEVIPDAPGGERGVVDLRMHRSYDPLLGAAGSTGDAAAHPSRDIPADWDVPDPWYGGHEDLVETLHLIERVFEGAEGDSAASILTKAAQGCGVTPRHCW